MHWFSDLEEGDPKLLLLELLRKCHRAGPGSAQRKWRLKLSSTADQYKEKQEKQKGVSLLSSPCCPIFFYCLLLPNLTGSHLTN